MANPKFDSLTFSDGVIKDVDLPIDASPTIKSLTLNEYLLFENEDGDLVDFSLSGGDLILRMGSTGGGQTGDLTIPWNITGDVISTGTISSYAVTSVALRNGSTSQGTLSISGSPITSSGTIDITLANNYGDTKNPYAKKNAHYVLAGNGTGSSDSAPSFRALTSSDIPDLSGSYLPLSGGQLTANATPILTLKKSAASSGAFLGFKNNNQDLNMWYVGMDSAGNLRFSSTTNGGIDNTKQAQIDTSGNLYEGDTKLSDKYQAKLPTTSTASKLLVSTTTSGTTKWSDFSTAGLLKTDNSGVISVDTNIYLPLSAGSTKKLTGDLYLNGHYLSFDGSNLSTSIRKNTKTINNASRTGLEFNAWDDLFFLEAGDGTVVINYESVTGTKVYTIPNKSANDTFAMTSDLSNYALLNSSNTFAGNQTFENNVLINGNLEVDGTFLIDDGNFHLGTDETAYYADIAGPSDGFDANRVIRFPDKSGTIVVTSDGNAVTSVATSGTGLSGGTITTTGTITLDSSSAGNAAQNKVVLRNAVGSIQSEKIAISSGTTTKLNIQYNTTDDCLDFVFA